MVCSFSVIVLLHVNIWLYRLLLLAPKISQICIHSRTTLLTAEAISVWSSTQTTRVICRNKSESVSYRIMWLKVWSSVCMILCTSVAAKLVVDCRFDPKNMHQCPQVVVLCGSGNQAVFAVNCARQLASRRIHLTLFTPDSLHYSDGLEVEMKLLQLTGAKIKTSNYNSTLHHYIQ